MALSGPLSGGASTPTPPTPPSTLNDGIISYYDSDGTDRKGSNNLTAVNGPIATGVGKVSASCMDFDRASSQYYNLPDVSAADFEPNQSISFAFWHRAETVVDYEVIHSKGTGVEERSYFGANGALLSQWGAAVSIPGAPGDVVAGVWQHVYLYHDHAANAIYRSINGAALTFDSGLVSISNTAPFTLGSQGAGNYFDGLIDQFCLWHRDLTPAEIAELYNGGSGTDFLVP